MAEKQPIPVIAPSSDFTLSTTQSRKCKCKIQTHQWDCWERSRIHLSRECFSTILRPCVSDSSTLLSIILCLCLCLCMYLYAAAMVTCWRLHWTVHLNICLLCSISLCLGCNDSLSQWYMIYVCVCVCSHIHCNCSFAWFHRTAWGAWWNFRFQKPPLELMHCFKAGPLLRHMVLPGDMVLQSTGAQIPRAADQTEIRSLLWRAHRNKAASPARRHKATVQLLLLETRFSGVCQLACTEQLLVLFTLRSLLWSAHCLCKK